MRIFFLLLTFPLITYSLVIDSKFSSQIINVSKTRKTVITKRGLDDGIRLGDHAKLFDKEGMFAWAMAVKLSPNRTVWHVYQTVNVKKLKPGKKMGLKMSAPALGKEKMATQFSKISKKESKSVTAVKLRDKPLPIGSTPLYFDLFASLSTASHSFSKDSETSSIFNQRDQKSKGNKFLIGISYPFYRFAFGASLSYGIDQSERNSGFRTKTKSYEVAFSVEYNFSTPPYYEKFFPFLHLGFGFGNIDLQRTATASTGVSLPQEFNDQKGRTKSTFLGAGMKKVYPIGLGLKANIDYIIRKEFLEVLSNGNDTKREKQGAQVSLGLFYQFR